MRMASLKRKTGETSVEVSLGLDGDGTYSVSTGIGFLDHMLALFARHSLIDLEVQAHGDLHVDMHHTVEDVGITIGQALSRAGPSKFTSLSVSNPTAIIRPLDTRHLLS